MDGCTVSNRDETGWAERDTVEEGAFPGGDSDRAEELGAEASALSDELGVVDKDWRGVEDGEGRIEGLCDAPDEEVPVVGAGIEDGDWLLLVWTVTLDVGSEDDGAMLESIEELGGCWLDEELIGCWRDEELVGCWLDEELAD